MEQFSFDLEKPAVLEKDIPLIVMPFGWCPINDPLPEGIKCPVKVIIAGEVDKPKREG